MGVGTAEQMAPYRVEAAALFRADTWGLCMDMAIDVAGKQNNNFTEKIRYRLLTS